MLAETIKKYSHIYSVVALFIVAGIWGSGFPIIKIALDSGVLPNAMVGIRFIVAFFLMFIFLKIRGTVIKKEEIKIGLGVGVLLFLAFSAQTIGAVHTSASKSAFITGANVVMVPFVYWILSKEKPKVIVYFTSILCFIGIGILSLERDITLNYGDTLTFIGSIFFAVHMVVIGLSLKNYNPLTVNCFQMLSAGILGIIFNLFFESKSLFETSFNTSQVIALGIIIVFNTFLCYLIQTSVQKFVLPSRVALILSTEMVFGAVFSVLIMGDLVTLKLVLGGIIIFISIIIAEIRN